MDATVELGRNPVSKHQIQPSTEMSKLTLDGTAEPVSRDQILRRKFAEREIFIFAVQLTTSRIGNLTRLIHTLAICVTIHMPCTQRSFFQLGKLWFPSLLARSRSEEDWSRSRAGSSPNSLSTIVGELKSPNRKHSAYLMYFTMYCYWLSSAKSFAQRSTHARGSSTRVN